MFILFLSCCLLFVVLVLVMPTSLLEWIGRDKVLEKWLFRGWTDTPYSVFSINISAIQHFKTTLQVYSGFSAFLAWTKTGLSSVRLSQCLVPHLQKDPPTLFHGCPLMSPCCPPPPQSGVWITSLFHYEACMFFLLGLSSSPKTCDYANWCLCPVVD